MTYFLLVISFYHVFSFFFFVIDVHFSIPVVIAQSFIVAAELAIPTVISTKEAKADVEIHPVTVEAKIRKFSVLYLKSYKKFYDFY